MRRSLIPLSTLALLAAANAFAAPDTGLTGIVPAAQDWEAKSGTFVLNADKVVITVASKDAKALKSVAEALRDDLTPQGFPNIEIVTGDKAASGGVFLALTSGAFAHSVEAHAVTISDTVTIAGNSPAAVLLGTRSLLQMNKAHGGKIPCGVVQDWPDYPRRMMMLDVGRKPWPLPVLKDYIRTLAWHKMNELHLHLSDEAFGESYSAIRVQSDVFPGLAAKDLAYTKQEIRELVAFAKNYGVTITPEFDMPGHAAAFTSYFKDCMLKGYPNYLDVSNPKTLEVMKKFVDEMIPLFDAPDFHIGTDEYRIGDWRKNPKVDKVHEDFRKFINAMNAHIRSRGKNMRVWSGYESMGGKSVKIDPTVIVDMWDPYNDEHIGHPVINASQFVTYYVPGAHYYGVSPGDLYDGFIPWNAGGNPKKPVKGDPLFLGGKLHVWCDHGPTGYTMTEIADLSLPGIQAISEKLWGTKGSSKYNDFRTRAEAVLPVPGVTVLDRLEVSHIPNEADIVLNIPGEVALTNVNATVELPLANAERADLEYPWTLTMQVRKTQEAPGRNVLLSSDLVEVCGNYTRKEKITTKFADGTERKADVNFAGLGLTRAAGARRGSGTPAETYLGHDVSKAFGKELETGKWTTVTLVGTRGSTALFVDGLKVGTTNNQMVCPLRRLGSAHGQSFVGELRKIKVLNRALTDAEVGRAAGLDIPENIARGCKVTASVSDEGYGLVATNVTDADGGSRWSSGRSGAQWLMIDLGSDKKIGGTAITWENAFAKKYAVEVSNDGTTWKEVFSGEGKVGEIKTTWPTASARYVRLNLKEAATSWGYSIFNVEVLAGK
jgi:hexosaminidase